MVCSTQAILLYVGTLDKYVCHLLLTYIISLTRAVNGSRQYYLIALIVSTVTVFIDPGKYRKVWGQ